jgi:flagellar hook-associated protein 2
MSGAVSSLGSSQISSEISTVEARLEKPITALQDQQTTDKAIISAWGVVSGSVSSLSTALAGIKDISTINNRSATSTLSTVATATAANTAAVGQYSLTGVTLAKTQEIYSAVLGSGSAKLGSGSGSLTITLKGGKTEQVQVGSGSLTLNGVAAAVNKLAGGVQASVIGTSTGARLVLQGSATGSSQAFSVQGTGALQKFDYSSAGTGGSGSFTRAQAAGNASFSINGVPVTSTTNTITTAVSGVTIALAGSGSTTLSVSSSPGGIANAVDSVATSLNAALSSIAKETAFTATSSTSSTSSASSATAGPLLGNFTATDLTNQLLTSVSGAAASGVTSNTIGLSVSSTGSVSFNSATFAAAYAKNPTAVTTLINQIYKSLSTVTTGALGSSGTNGSINAQTTGLNDDVTSINSQIASITTSNNDQLQILVQEYTAAETASTSASITESYLSIFNSSTSGSSTG